VHTTALPKETLLSSKRQKRDHYIDNERFFREMQEWKKTVHEAEQTGEKEPPVTPYIGECFLKIAEQLSSKPNFAHYAYRDEMICDAVENCVVYAANFDPDKSSNPFSYFTQIIYYAFLRRIQREKKQSFIKYKMVKDKIAEGSLGKFANRMKGLEENDSSFEYRDFAAKKFDLSENDIDNFTRELEKEDKRGKKKKKAKKPKGLENLFEETDEDRSNL
jgi:hypothetical protein